MERTYMCIDLKTFFASVECVERGLDPFTTNLVVADPSRGKGAICLAVSPSLKAMGVKNRCRIFEIPASLDYIVALPRMKKYIEYAANIYAIYLKYVSKDDIHVYSIDEVFMDVTNYLKLYKLDAFEFADILKNAVFKQTGISATVGIGTNMFLAKVAMDIIAKHTKEKTGYLNEQLFKENLWHYTPLTDFWGIGRGMSKRLLKHGIVDLFGVAHTDPSILKKEFGVNALILIDHASGIEPCTMQDIKKYKSKNNSISSSQILFEDYNYDNALLVVKEMVDNSSLELIDKGLVTNSVSLVIGYSNEAIKATGGSITMDETTNVYSVLVKYFVDIFNKTTHKDKPIRRIGVSFNNVVDEAYEQYNLFSDTEKIQKEKEIEKTLNSIKKKFGKNSILKGMNYLDKATAKKRNTLIGGHNGGEE